MCQIKEKKLNKRSVIVYRLYRRKTDDGIYSLFEWNKITPLNNKVKSNNIYRPFHSFASLKALQTWYKVYFHVKQPYTKDEFHKTVLIYKCKLSGDLISGKWAWEDTKVDSGSTTITGKYLTVLEDVTNELMPKVISGK